MLIHVTHFTRVQQAVYNQVREELSSVRQKILRVDGGLPKTPLSDLLQLWEEGFIPTTESFEDPDYPAVSWGSMEPLLGQIVFSIEVRLVLTTRFGPL